jgi:4-aminobutyrate aminotransferase-like enzyme
VSDTVAKHKEFLFPAVANYYQEPLALVRGEGMHVWDDKGDKYLDCFGGVLTVSVGHANPAVVKAQVDQLGKMSHMSALYANENPSNLAEKLAEITPGELRKTFFTNSGTEANETAVLAAKLFTQRQEIVVLRHSYSGRSASALAACGHAPWRAIASQVPGFTHAHAPYCYRCPFHKKFPDCNLECAEDIEELIKTTTMGKIAAFMAEPILGVGGFIVPPPGYFERAVEIARKHGGLFISDEVQTGWGRTGGKWFGIEHWDVEPDIITSAKGLGNGAPIGVTIAKSEIAQAFPAPTISTFGGNPVSTAAALAVIKEIEDKGLRENAQAMGEYFQMKLEELKSKHEVVGDVRGKGLMQGIEFVKDKESKEPAPAVLNQVFEGAKKRKVLVGKGGLYGNVMRLGPPLIAGKDHIDELIAALDESLSES